MPGSSSVAVARLRTLLATEPPAPTESVAEVLGRGSYDPGRRGAWALAGIGLVAALVAGFVLLRGRASEQPVAVPSVVAGTQTSTATLVVDVEGKVRHPGLVRVSEGSRVDDALRAAGGVLPGASTASLNLARKVADGEQLLVGLDPAPGAGAPAAAQGGLVDLNLAAASDLDGLPGIGPVLAQRIVDWRTQHGRFASVDQLRQVSGIGESKYALIKTKVRV
jgi:competence protein ComEA